MSLNIHRPVRNGRTAKFLTGVFALSFMLSMTVQPLVFSANAGAVLSITCDNVSINGSVWTFSGTWQAIDFGGQASQYNTAVFSPSGTSVDDSSKDSPDTFSITNTNEIGGNVHNGDMAGTWSNQVNFNANPSEVFATLYHSQIPGNEKSGDATCSFTLPVTTYTLTYTAGSNGTISGTSPQTVNSGANGTAVTAVADLGYHFANWSDTSTANPRTDTNVTANVSVTANFAADVVIPGSHNINASAGSNGSINPNGVVSVTDGQDQAFTITADTGYHVADVLVDGVSVGAVTTYNFTNNSADHTIAASFAANQYTLTYTAGSNGSITGTSPQTVSYSDDGTAVTAVPNTGYHFVDWSDGVTTTTRTDTNVIANISVTANFAQNSSLPQCSDGVNNDGDQVVDSADAGCHTDGDVSNTSSYDPQDNNETYDELPPVSAFADTRNHIVIDTEMVSLALVGSSNDDVSGFGNATIEIYRLADEATMLADGFFGQTNDEIQSPFEALTCSPVPQDAVQVLAPTALTLAGSGLNVTWSYDWTISGKGVYCAIVHATDAAGNVEHTGITGPFAYNPTATVSPSPSPSSTPTPTSGGGGGGSSGGGGGSYYYPTPTPSVAPSSTPTPEVLGATTTQTLPATSLSWTDSLTLSLFSAMTMTGMMMTFIGFGFVPKKLEDYLN